jgi:hypothetical protein
MKALEGNRDEFFRFICMGKALIDYANRGDIDNFKRLFFESNDFEMTYWHITKAFKIAYDNRYLNLIEFMINDL